MRSFSSVTVFETAPVGGGPVELRRQYGESGSIFVSLRFAPVEHRLLLDIFSPFGTSPTGEQQQQQQRSLQAVTAERTSFSVIGGDVFTDGKERKVSYHVAVVGFCISRKHRQTLLLCRRKSWLGDGGV